jgi:phosphatidate cytidylyltransferase
MGIFSLSKELKEELKLRVLSGVIMFSSAVFLVSIGGFFFTSALIFISLFCASEIFFILGKAEVLEVQRKKLIYKGVSFVAIPTISLYTIREIFANGTLVTFWLFIFVVFVDTFAYFTGKLIGKYKLAPSISPSKTIEGLVGGVLFATLFSLSFYYLFQSKLNIFIFIFMSVILGILAQISDLIESGFKRKFGVKDSSDIIPGHGGFLDRLDGYLLTSPALVIFYFVFKTFFGVGIFS